VFDFSRTFRGVNIDFFFNFSDIFLISPTSDLSDFLRYILYITTDIWLVGWTSQQLTHFYHWERSSPHPAIVPIEGTVLLKLGRICHKDRNNGSPISVALSFMKIHFVGKSLWVMHNNNGVKQRFLACFLKILDKNVKIGENYSLTSTRYYFT
jgi:hypothetical protein